MDSLVFRAFVKYAKLTHAQQRFPARSKLSPTHLKRMEGLVAEANQGSLAHLPGEFTVPFKDRSSAVMERIKTQRGEKLVMKTVLGPGMRGRGPVIPARLVMSGARPLTLAAYVTGPSGAGKTTYSKQHFPRSKYTLLHADDYAEGFDPVRLEGIGMDWGKLRKDVLKAKKPVVLDSSLIDIELAMAADKRIIIHPNKAKLRKQWFQRDADDFPHRNKEEARVLFEERLNRFKTEDLPVAKAFGFKKIKIGVKQAAKHVTGQPMVYHGSPKELSTVMPKAEYAASGGAPAVFAAPSRSFALAYMGRWSDRDITQSSHDGGRMSLREMRPGVFKDIFDKPGYLHSLPAKNFKPVPGSHGVEVVSKAAVIPIRVERIRDPLKALQRDPKTTLHSYDPKSPGTQRAMRIIAKRMQKMGPSEGKAYAEWYLEKATPEIKGMLKKAAEYSVKKDEKGWYVATHRARSKSYPTREAIPGSVKRQIGSTG